MLVVADFILLGWKKMDEFGAGWFVKECEDELDCDYQLHYDYATGKLTIWGNDKQKIFCDEVKSVNGFPTMSMGKIIRSVKIGNDTWHFVG